MTIAACPKCHDEVTIPPGAPRAAQVRCPWCREEFGLADVLDRMPPMLEIVSAPTVAPGESDAQAGFGASSDDDFRLSDADASPTPDFSFGGGTTTAAPAVAAPRPRTAKAASTRPRRKEKSAVAEMVKVVLGGVVGLILAQLILWWLPEPYKRDPIEIGPTVGKYVPWIVPAEYRPRGDSAGGGANSGDRNGSAGGQSQLAMNDTASRPARSTAGGDASGGFSLPRANDADAGDFGSQSPFSLRAETNDDDPFGLPAEDNVGLTPADPLAIPEPDLTLAPGADVMDDPLDAADPFATPDPSVTLDAEESPDAQMNNDPQSTPAFDTPTADPLMPDADPQEAPSDTPAPNDAPQEPAASESVASLPDDAKPQPTVPDSPAPATPDAPPADTFIGVNDAPMYVADEVREAVAQTQAAEQAMQSSDGSAEVAVQYYTAITDLAEKLTYSDPLDAKINEAVQQIKQMLAQGNLRERAKLVATHGPARLSAKKEERPNNGIVLFGQVQTIEKQGALYEIRLEMPTASGRSVVPLFAKDEPEFKEGARIFALGTLVDDPAKRLSGYDGRLPSIVWVGATVNLSP